MKKKEKKERVSVPPPPFKEREGTLIPPETQDSSSFILHPSSFILHPSSFILHPSSFILHPSSFILLKSVGLQLDLLRRHVIAANQVHADEHDGDAGDERCVYVGLAHDPADEDGDD